MHKLFVGESYGEAGASNTHRLENTDVAQLLHYHGVLKGHWFFIWIRFDAPNKPRAFPENEMKQFILLF